MFENKLICAECGGKCCKHVPGMAHPSDFGDNLERLEAALETGRWNITGYWDITNVTDLTIINYVQPSIKGQENIIVNGNFAGYCTFLGDNGCEFSEHERPYECRHLEPKENMRCISHGIISKRELVLEWLPYADLLDQIVSKLDKKKTPAISGVKERR